MVKKKEEEPKKKRKTPIDNRKATKRITGSKVGRPRIRTDKIGLREELGAPSKFNEDLHCRLAHELAMLEYTHEQIAQKMGICEKTFYVWKNKFPLFLQSLENGRHAGKNQAIKTLSQRMSGYTVAEEGEKVVGGEVVTLKSKKELPPDVRAAEIVLSRWDRMLDRELKKESGLSDDEMLEAIREGIRAKMQSKQEDALKKDD